MGGIPSGQFLCLLYGPPQISFFAYYTGAPSDQLLRMLYGGPLRSVSLHTIWGSRQISFFAYYMRPPPRSVSLLTIWGLLIFFYVLHVKLQLGGGNWPLSPPPAGAHAHTILM